MPVLRFVGGANFPAYHDQPADWTPGCEREVADEKAKYLLSTFTGLFEPVDQPAKAIADSVGKETAKATVTPNYKELKAGTKVTKEAK